MTAGEHLTVLNLPRELREGSEIYRFPVWAQVTKVEKRTTRTRGGYHRAGSVTRYKIFYRMPDGEEHYLWAAPNRRIETCTFHKPPEVGDGVQADLG